MKGIKIVLCFVLSLILLTTCSKQKKETFIDLVDSTARTVSPSSGLQLGDTIPAYLGVNEDDQPILSDDYRGSKIVLYFYPKDETPGCTTQACNLRDNYDSLIDQGYIVFGVSTDSIRSHRNFINKEQLPFSLIADIDTTLIKQFGAIENNKPTRTTFLIDENGVIVDIISPAQVNVTDHTIQILNFNN